MSKLDAAWCGGVLLDLKGNIGRPEHTNTLVCPLCGGELEQVSLFTLALKHSGYQLRPARNKGKDNGPCTDRAAGEQSEKL